VIENNKQTYNPRVNKANVIYKIIIYQHSDHVSQTRAYHWWSGIKIPPIRGFVSKKG